MRIKKGFTLAEILIVLMVIGVIATMTIPSLMKGVAEAQYKAGYKKAYNTIVNLAAMEKISGQLPTVSTDDGAKMFLVAMTNSLSYKEFVNQSLNAGTIISNGDAKPAMKIGDNIYGLTTATDNNVEVPTITTTANSTWIVTDDGIAYSLLLGKGSGDCSTKNAISGAASTADAISNSCLVVVVDVNGLYKGPNRLEKQTETGDNAAADKITNATTRMTTLVGDQYYIYVGSDGATAGPVGTTVSGRIVADLK